MTQDSKGGRPTLFTPELAERICDAVATNARSLEWVCENTEGFPSARTVSRWQAADEKFCQELTRAYERRADILIDECIDIADETSRDTKLVGRKDAPESLATEVCNYEWISRSKLRIETRLKLAAMLNRKKYGEKLEVTTIATKALAPRPSADEQMAGLKAIGGANGVTIQ